MVKVKLTKQINKVNTKIYPSNETLLKITKYSNETKLKGYLSTSFISKFIGRIKMSNDTKFKAKQTNE